MNYFEGRTILLTGGTGSFGHHFTRTALSRWNPKTIRIFSRDELKQSEMQRSFGDDRLRFLIGDVRDHQRLRRAVDGVDIVIHAAAMKQVPACEYNPFEAVQTNILGTQNVAEVCIEAGFPRAVALSTDKAVSPASLYGATKLCAESCSSRPTCTPVRMMYASPAFATATWSVPAAAWCRSSATRRTPAN